jgi:16S rRNA processing protein RimM
MTKEMRSYQTYKYRNQQVIVPDGYLAIGQIAGVHGLRGEVKVELHTDYPDRFATGAVLYMGANLAKTTIESVRPHKSHLLIRFQGVYNREDAEELRGHWLFVDEADAAVLEDDVYWVHDIVGLAVYDQAERLLGEITDVLFTGANEVYAIKPAPGVNQDKELLLPAIAAVVQDVNLEDGVMIVVLPNGLIEGE